MEASVKTQVGTFTFLKNDFIYQYIARKSIPWSIELLKMFLPLLKPGDVVLDVGSHVGTLAVPISKTVGNTGKVYAFEPQQRMMDLLEKNVIQNNCTNIHLCKLCVGHITREASLNNKFDYGGGTLNYNNNAASRNYGGVDMGIGGEKVNMVALDDIEFDRLNLIKIDVEGAEKLVIWGAKETIRKHRPIIIYETNIKGITNNMVKLFGLTPDIITFDIEKFLFQELQYSEKKLHNKTNNGDWIFIP